MNPQATPQPETGKLGPPRWQVTVYQVLFGAMAVTFGGLISAEPTLLLERQDEGRIEAWYALEAYGRVPTLRYAVRDLVRYEVVRSEESGSRGTRSSGAAAPRTSYNLVLRDRDGSSFAVGQAFDLLPIDRMLEGRHPERAHQERIAAGNARRRGGWGLGAFGLLLLAGAAWNLWLMATGLGSPEERAAAALTAGLLVAPGAAVPVFAAGPGVGDGDRPGRPVAVSPRDAAEFARSPTACPPFSWTLLPEAREYELAVVELPDGLEERSSPSARPFEGSDEPETVVLRRRVPGGASHWLPSADQCLSPGRR